MELFPLLRTTLGGLNAFDSPGMAVSFVMGFCLALRKDMKKKKQTKNLCCKNTPRPTGRQQVGHLHVHSCHYESTLFSLLWVMKS